MTASVNAAQPPGRFRHQAFFYASDTEFVAGVGRCVRDALANGASVVVAEPRDRIEALRDALGGDAGAVEFLDMSSIGANPARMIPVWDAVARRHRAAGRPLCGVGEPVWPGRRAVELAECHLHELLLNLAFGQGPGWQLICPYDRVNLPPTVVADALHTHPAPTTGGVAGIDGADVARAFAAPLTPPPATAQRLDYGAGDIVLMRRVVREFATRCGLPAVRVDELVLATNEIVVNTMRHAGAHGTMLSWLQPDAVVVEFRDRGRVADPLVGRRVPPLRPEGGRGIYLVNQLCDLVQLRSSEQGTVIRLTMWR